MVRLTVNGIPHKIPAYPNYKHYIYTSKRFFEAKSFWSFISLNGFLTLREFWRFYIHRCGIPRLMLVDPTNACNLRCKGCWAGEYDQGDRLTFDRLSRLVDEAKELGILGILFTGGEPLVRKADILALAERHRRFYFGIFTNGTLIDEPFVQKLNEMGNVGIFVSIEGFREETDFRRGEGTYDRVLEAMAVMKRYDYAFGFSLCYHRENYLTVTSDAFLDFLRERGAWFGWAFAYRPIGNDADVSLCLDAEAREMSRTRIDDYCRRKDFHIVDMFNNGHKVFGCVGAGSGYIHITAGGDVEPCAFCHYSDANINEMPLRKALQSPFLRAFRRSQPFSCDPLRPCPLMDVPEMIVKLVNGNAARSTHSANPESVERFASKVRDLAQEWEQYASTRSRPYAPGERKRYRALTRVLRFRKILAGDTRRANAKKNGV